MVPAQILPARVPVRADPGAKPPHLLEERLPAERVQVFIHGAPPGDERNIGLTVTPCPWACLRRRDAGRLPAPHAFPRAGPARARGHVEEMHDRGRRDLDVALDRLQTEVPARLARAIGWLRTPERRPFRMAAGVLSLIGGLLWFLPVLGIWLIPLGLLLLAQDVPMLRGPVGRATLRLTERWRSLRASRRRRRPPPPRTAP